MYFKKTKKWISYLDNNRPQIMTTDKVKIINTRNGEKKHTRHNNWEVMKPFVIFSFKALKIIGLGLLAIIRALPALKPRPNDTNLKRR
jgi:hypothetical protein